MLGFPLSLPLDGLAERKVGMVYVAPNGQVAQAGDHQAFLQRSALVIELRSKSEVAALKEWLANGCKPLASTEVEGVPV